MLAATVFFLMMAATAAYSATALVPEGTKFTHEKNADGSYTVIITGPVKIRDGQVYRHNGQRNVNYSAEKLGGDEKGGPYQFVVKKHDQAKGYQLNAYGFNFQHFVLETLPDGSCPEVVRWAYWDGYEFAGGKIPAWSNFDPKKKTGVVVIAVTFRGEPGAEIVVFETLSPIVQDEFLKTHYGDGTYLYPPIVVR